MRTEFTFLVELSL